MAGADRVWSVGYDWHTPASLVALLRSAGVEQVVDVRQLPLSRRPGFSKAPIARTLEAAGIQYHILRALGAPKDLRTGKAGAWSLEEFRGHYRDHLHHQLPALMELAHLASERPTAMMCVEEDPEDCHRIVLHEALRADGFEVIDLRDEGGRAAGDD